MVQGAKIADLAQGRGPGDIAIVFQSMIPPNIFKAAADGQILGDNIFCIFIWIFYVSFKSRFSSTYD